MTCPKCGTEMAACGADLSAEAGGGSAQWWQCLKCGATIALNRCARCHLAPELRTVADQGILDPKTGDYRGSFVMSGCFERCEQLKRMHITEIPGTGWMADGACVTGVHLEPEDAVSEWNEKFGA
jgi:hypothetical protein